MKLIDTMRKRGLFTMWTALLTLVAIALVGVFSFIDDLYISERTDLTLKINDATLQHAQALLDKEGPLERRGDKLYAGATLLNSSTAIVDAVQAATGFGCTIFLDNVRIQTTAVAKNGTGRALGTRANAEVTEKVFRQGGNFRGVTETIGRDWVIHYTPLRDPNGDIVGMLATFRELEQLLGDVRTFRLTFGVTLVLLFAMLLSLAMLGIRVTRRHQRSMSRAKHAVHEAERIRDTAFNLEEMQVKLKQSAALFRGDGGTGGLLAEMNTASDAGQETMRRSNEDIRGLIDQYQAISSQVAELSDSSRAIADVTDRILRLSNRLDMIALNCSLEAARAGDYGGGFYLISQDIQRLAVQMQDHSGEIRDVLAVVENRVTAILNTSTHGQTLTADGLTQLARMSGTFEAIYGLMQRAADAADNLTLDVTMQIAQTQALLERSQEDDSLLTDHSASMTGT